MSTGVVMPYLDMRIAKRRSAHAGILIDAIAKNRRCRLSARVKFLGIHPRIISVRFHERECHAYASELVIGAAAYCKHTWIRSAFQFGKSIKTSRELQVHKIFIRAIFSNIVEGRHLCVPFGESMLTW